MPDVLITHGVALSDAPRASSRLRDVAAYLEMHIEQGPVLEDAGLALGVVDAVFGVERHRVRFEGQSAHSGSTPMRLRHDPLIAASQLVLAVRRGAVEAGGVATVGEIEAAPGIPTAIPGRATLMLDQRHHDADSLSQMLEDAQSAAQTAADEEGALVSWTAIQRTAPVAFDERLVELAEECVVSVSGSSLRLPSGALHDAVMVARADVPTVMLFVQSIGGISHNRIEDSRREHIELGVEALDLLAAASSSQSPARKPHSAASALRTGRRLINHQPPRFRCGSIRQDHAVDIARTFTRDPASRTSSATVSGSRVIGSP